MPLPASDSSDPLRLRPAVEATLPAVASGAPKMAAADLRVTRQAVVDVRVAELRAKADLLDSRARGLLGGGVDDLAAAGPAFDHAAGRSLSRRREADRSSYLRAGKLSGDAKALRDQAVAMNCRGAVIAGDADAARRATAEKVAVSVGQTVRTALFGDRKVLKVNAKTVLVEGAFGPLKIEKYALQPLVALGEPA